MMDSHGSTPLENTGLTVFLANLDALPLPSASLTQFLTPGELQRASRLAGDDLRRRWTMSRGLLRSLLGLLLQRDPGQIALERTPEGKPFLPGGPAFNLSHSGPYLLVAITFRGDVGVDIEQHRPREDLDALVTRYFAPQEAAEIGMLPVSERSRAFLRTWVRKEAFLKGIGLGLQLPLSGFVVSVSREDGNVLRWVSDPGIREGGWQVASVPAPQDAEAAVAWNDREVVPILRPWPVS